MLWVLLVSLASKYGAGAASVPAVAETDRALLERFAAEDA